MKKQRHQRDKAAQLPAVQVRPPMGRPTKLTPELRDVIVNTILQGNTRGCAAARAGISYPTFCSWMSRGEAVDGKPNPTDEDVEFFTFFQLVNQAEGEAHAQSVKNIVGQGRKNFQAAAWWLERRWQKDWNKPERREVTNPDGSLAPKVLIYIPSNGREQPQEISIQTPPVRNKIAKRGKGHHEE